MWNVVRGYFVHLDASCEGSHLPCQGDGVTWERFVYLADWHGLLNWRVVSDFLPSTGFSEWLITQNFSLHHICYCSIGQCMWPNSESTDKANEPWLLQSSLPTGFLLRYNNLSIVTKVYFCEQCYYEYFDILLVHRYQIFYIYNEKENLWWNREIANCIS